MTESVELAWNAGELTAIDGERDRAPRRGQCGRGENQGDDGLARVMGHGSSPVRIRTIWCQIYGVVFSGDPRSSTVRRKPSEPKAFVVWTGIAQDRACGTMVRLSSEPTSSRRCCPLAHWARRIADARKAIAMKLIRAARRAGRGRACL